MIVDQPLLELADRFLSLTLLIYAVYKMSAALTNRTDQLIAHLLAQVASLNEQLKEERRLHNELHQNRIPRESDDLP